MNNVEEMESVIRYLCVPNKGILAADESINTIGKRFDTIGVDNTYETRFQYRKMLFSAEGIENHLSGVILNEESLNNGELRKYLYDKSILVGVKTDLGLTSIPFTNQQTTVGIDTLGERTRDCYSIGARFAKWRCVFNTVNLTDEVIEKNTRLLADYALISQLNGLVPIVEPEVLIDGALNVGRVEQATKKVLNRLVFNLNNINVRLDLMILKPNMIRTHTSTPHEIARRTMSILHEVLPPKIACVAFLSGGMNSMDAIHSLSLINEIGGPWRLTFSYGRALQSEALKIWDNKEENVAKAQTALLEVSQKAGACVMDK